ncbi:MAG: hypothetical protein HZB79_04290, partial [Deltaproteobacteria bacterium]|nr:hypothetical protein [Deltaproteobacteria bacterium]
MKDLTCFKAGKGFSVFLLITLLFILLANPTYADTQLKTQDIKPKIAKLNIPFILNQGQTHEDVRFYANTFGGTVFVTKDGSVVYSIPKDEARGDNGQEQVAAPFMGAIGAGIKPAATLAGEAGTKSKEAYGNNVEKLFYVQPDINPENIKIKLTGAEGININENGELEVKTELGTIKFTKPVAYQEIDGKRVEVEVNYEAQDTGCGSRNLYGCVEYAGMKPAATHELRTTNAELVY